MHWGMVIDLSKCFGCHACSATCQETNRVPGRQLRTVHDCGVTAPPARQRIFLPSSCMHCREAPCEQVCPTGATRYGRDGDVTIDEARCIGCGYCIVACPYRARHIYERDPEAHMGPPPAAAEKNGSDLGVCVKCTFCRPRIERGMTHGLRPGEAADASPACVVNCSANALHFGDLDDPSSEVARLLREHRTVRMQESLGTEPSVFYIVPEAWLDELDVAPER